MNYELSCSLLRVIFRSQSQMLLLTLLPIFFICRLDHWLVCLFQWLRHFLRLVAQLIVRIF